MSKVKNLQKLCQTHTLAAIVQPMHSGWGGLFMPYQRNYRDLGQLVGADSGSNPGFVPLQPCILMTCGLPLRVHSNTLNSPIIMGHNSF